MDGRPARNPRSLRVALGGTWVQQGSRTLLMNQQWRIKRPVGVQQRRALQLLSSIPFGVAEANMLAQGFTRRTLTSLVRAGFATTESMSVKAGDKALATGRSRITAAGRSWLED
jgi:hypothetical protein